MTLIDAIERAQAFLHGSNLTEVEVTQLRAEAATAGDLERVAVCDVAIGLDRWLAVCEVTAVGYGGDEDAEVEALNEAVAAWADCGRALLAHNMGEEKL